MPHVKYIKESEGLCENCKYYSLYSSYNDAGQVEENKTCNHPDFDPSWWEEFLGITSPCPEWILLEENDSCYIHFVDEIGESIKSFFQNRFSLLEDYMIKVTPQEDGYEVSLPLNLHEEVNLVISPEEEDTFTVKEINSNVLSLLVGESVSLEEIFDCYIDLVSELYPDSQEESD